MFQQQLAQRGFAGLGETRIADSRPSIDYVKAGDVIRVHFIWSNNLPASGSAEERFKAELGKAFNVLAMTASRGWTFNGDVTVELQPRGDYSKLSDVVAIVAHDAYEAGLGIYVGGMRGEFVSKVETTGGNVPSTLPDPRTAPNTGNSGDGIADFFSGLTQSPVTLAVILGAAVVLVIAAKK